MSIDLRRSHSRSSDLRPRVSFNRDVHVKRYGNKTLGKIEEEEREEMKSRGRADGTDYNNRRNSISEEKNKNNSSGVKDNKESIAKRIKHFFTRKSNHDDQVRTRYKEYKGGSGGGEDYDRERRRDSAPETKGSWFRSLERTKRAEKEDLESGMSRSSRNLRYFGESEMEDDRRTANSLAATTSNSKYQTGTSSRRRGYLQDSTDDATDAEPGRYDSLVFLHAAQVRDIPSRTVQKPRKRHLTRSVSLVGPWTPSHRPIARTGPVRDTGTQTMTRQAKEKPSSNQGDRKLRELVFTGPSIERTTREWKGRV